MTTIIITIIATITIICLGIFCTALTKVIKGSKDTASNQTTVIVLGCKVNNTKPSVALEARINAAIEHLNKNADAVAILSGGQGKGESISEAQCMADYMLNKGINKNRLYLEDKSTNTDENILFSKQIIKNNNLSNHVVIATSDYHQYRAKMICRKNGIDSYTKSARSGSCRRPLYFVRDALGVIYQWIFA